MAKTNITRKTKLGELLEKNEDAAEILFDSGMGCVGCRMAFAETIEDGCRAHGMDEKDIDALVKKLNK